MKSYINVFHKDRDTLIHTFVEDGKRKSEEILFKPFCAVSTEEDSNWKDIFEKNVKPRTFQNISDWKAWKKENSEYIPIYGNIQEEYQFIASRYQKEVKVQKEGIKILNFDIEVFSKEGFPSPLEAAHPINAITIQDMNKNIFYVYAYRDDYTPEEKNVIYTKCKDEKDLLLKIVEVFREVQPDILTGWNITNFDIPYLIHRLQNQISANAHNKLSPVGRVNKHIELDLNNNETVTYSIVGIINYDYMFLYKKFIPESRESYSLDYIAKYEIGKEKVKFKEEHDDLATLYEEDFPKFITYNMRDVDLVYLIDKKIKLIDLGLMITYIAKCLPEDVYGVIKVWDAFIYNEMMSNKIFCPPAKTNIRQEYPGGYVLDPKPGLYKWVGVYDIASSYPNQIRSFNVSTECVIDDFMLTDELLRVRSEIGNIEACLDQDALEQTKYSEILKKHNVTMAPNGHFFRTDIDGIIPKLVAKIFLERKQIKKNMRDMKKNTSEYTSADAKQGGLKVLINACYGAMASPYFRYFDIRMASAITCGGQACVRGIAKYINEKLDVKVLGMDTDSNFIHLESIVNKRWPSEKPDKKTIAEFLLKYENKILEPKIEEFLQRLSVNLNMKKLTIRMESESIADSCILLGKKRYAMKQIWKEGDFYLDKTKLKITGIEIVRTSTPQVIRDSLKRAIELIFETESNEKLIEYIAEVKADFEKRPFHEVAFPRSCNNMIKYGHPNAKGVPIACRAGLLYNDLINKMGLKQKYRLISEGDKIKFCYLSTPNKIGSNIIGSPDKMPSELSGLFQLDYDVQFEKAFLAPIDKIFEAIGWRFRDTQISLESFFN